MDPKWLKKENFDYILSVSENIRTVNNVFFSRSISRSTGTGDFEFFTFFPCTGDFEFLRFLLCAGDFEFFTFFFLCTGDFEFLRLFALYWRL